jgi:hypothetical protein
MLPDQNVASSLQRLNGISGADVYRSPNANLNGGSIGTPVDIRTVRRLEADAFVNGSP